MPSVPRPAFRSRFWFGVVLAAAGNVVFAVGNLVILGYPSQAGLLVCRGTGAAGLASLELARAAPPRWSRRGVLLGLVQALHMLGFTTLLRAAPAWFAPAVLAAAPAMLWGWGAEGPRRASGSRDRVAGGAVLGMLAAACLASLDPAALHLPWFALPLGLATTGCVAARYLLADRWTGQYRPANSLFVAFVAQVGLGFVLAATCGMPVTFVAGPAVLGAVSSVAGHRMLFAAAGKAAPTVVAAFAPVATVTTVLGAALCFGQPVPSLLRSLALVGWLVGSAVVAVRLQPAAAPLVELDAPE